MNELIKITENNGRKAVSARDLYLRLGLAEQHWGRYYKKNITDNQFAIENEDWAQLPLMGRTVDFALSIDFAKKLSMMARTEAGEKIRDYFIEVEKQTRAVAKPLTTLDMLEMSIKQLREQESRVQAIEAEQTSIRTEVAQIKAASQTRPDYFTIVGYATLNKIQIGLPMAAKLGSKASRICKQNGYLMDEIPDPRFGRVRMYPKMVLETVFNDPI